MQNGIYKLKIDVQEPYLSLIKSGKKKIEGRLGKDKYLLLQKGDLIKINDIEIEILRVTKYISFREMLIKEGVENTIPGAKDLNEAINVYYKFYSKEDEKKFGVVGILIKLK